MLIRHTLLYLPAQIVGPAAQLFAIFIFTHLMAPDAYGVFTYVLASQDLVFLLCLSWWSQYTVRYFRAGDAADVAEAGAYRATEGLILASATGLMAAAALVMLFFISVPLTLPLCAAAAFATATRGLALHLGERARAQSRFLDYTVAQAGGPVLGLALAVLLIDKITPTPGAGLLGYGIAQSGTLVWLVARQNVGLALHGPNGALLRQALAFGLPLIAAGVAAWVGLNAIRVIIDREVGTAAMGLVALGWNLGHRLTSTASMLVTVAAFPLAVESFREGASKEALGQITSNGLLMLGLVLPAAVGLYMIQGPLVSLLVAEPYRATTLAILPAALAAGLFRNIRTHVADQVFILIERTWIVCWVALAETTLVVAGCFLGLATHGIIGATYGAALGYGLASAGNFFVAQRMAGLRVPIFDACLVAGATALMVLVLFLLPDRTAGSRAPLAAVGLDVGVGVAVYAAAILVLFPSISRAVRARWTQIAAPASNEAAETSVVSSGSFGVQPPRSWK